MHRRNVRLTNSSIAAVSESVADDSEFPTFGLFKSENHINLFHLIIVKGYTQAW